MRLHRPGKVQGAGVQYTLVNGRVLPDGGYQAPLVALVCNLLPGGAARLSVVAVQTLFHEFGHVRRAAWTSSALFVRLYSHSDRACLRSLAFDMQL